MFPSAAIKDLQFSVVGFGGTGVRGSPRVHTMDGALFNSHDKLVRVIESFSTEAGKHDDVMEAVHFAANLPFRAGVAKAIILITCDLKSCQDNSIDYLELQDLLFDRDIRLHYLVEHEFATKKGKSVDIYGKRKFLSRCCYITCDKCYTISKSDKRPV